jgi:[lysine-biosynthesis-protein LysW]--L-2-aminoadipate ligase
MEQTEGRLLITEVNHTPEFHGGLKVAEVDIAGRMVEYVVAVAEGQR